MNDFQLLQCSLTSTDVSDHNHKCTPLQRIYGLSKKPGAADDELLEFPRKFVDLEYVKLNNPRRKKRKLDVLSAPYPESGSLFAVHTPPSTPRRVTGRTKPSAPSTPSTPSRLGVTSLNLNELRSFNFGDQTIIEECSTGELFPAPPITTTALEETVCLVHPDVVYEDEKAQAENLPALPDSTEIISTCERLYPTLLAQNAPNTLQWSTCATALCESTGPFYQCESCILHTWVCKPCMLSQHAKHPFDIISSWDSTKGCLVTHRLSDLGLVLRLAHEDGQTCKTVPTKDKERCLDVLHINGYHKILYYQCTCGTSSGAPRTASPEQLFANRLYPATGKNPRWAYTFDVLKQFDSLNIHGFINVKQFCDATLGLNGSYGEEVQLTQHFCYLLLNLI